MFDIFCIFQHNLSKVVGPTQLSSFKTLSKSK